VARRTPAEYGRRVTEGAREAREHGGEMRSGRSIAGVAAAAAAMVAAAASAPAALARTGCQAGLRFAALDRGAQVLDHNFRNPTSPQDLQGQPLTTLGPLLYAHAYEVHGGGVTLRGTGSSFAVGDGSLFSVTCHDGRDVALQFGQGSVTVRTQGRDPAGVITPEGLFAPLTGGTPLRFTVGRRSAKSLDGADPQTIAAVLTGVEDERVFGTTSVARVGRSKLAVNVTPYVGPREGDCRLVTSARLTSNATTVGRIKGHRGVYRHLVGTATYHLA
jgi:hypothetical protein